MPRYDVRCQEHGLHEVFHPMSHTSDFLCEADPDCRERVDVIISTPPYMSVSAEGEDSTNPARIADGTAKFNVGLPGIDTVVGQRPNGNPALSYRPITNNELPTAKARKDYAKRHGLVPVGTSVKRAIGGR